MSQPHPHGNQDHSGRWSPGRPRIVERCSQWYGPLAAGALTLALLGRMTGWSFSETPLVILSLPFSIVPLLAKASPGANILTCGLFAAGICAAFRWGRGAISHRLVAGLLVLWVLASMAFIGVFVRSHWLGPWPRLREAVRSFEAPPGFERVFVGEAGSEACFISCDEPRIAVVLTTTLPPDDACRAIQASVEAVAKRVGPPPSYVVQPPEAACFLQGGLPEVYSDARLVATVLSGADLRRYSWLLANASTTSFADADTVVSLLFNSGID